MCVFAKEYLTYLLKEAAKKNKNLLLTAGPLRPYPPSLMAVGTLILSPRFELPDFLCIGFLEWKGERRRGKGRELNMLGAKLHFKGLGKDNFFLGFLI